MEYFDVFNNNREPLNKIMVRGTKLAPDEFNTGIEVYIINDNKLLMTQRAPEKSHSGEWEVPGGCSQAGESIDDTIIREIQEEVNVKLESADYKLVSTQMYNQQFVDIIQTKIPVDINNIKLQEEEVSAIKWVTEAEFKNMAIKNQVVASVLDRFKKCQIQLDLNWETIN